MNAESYKCSGCGAPISYDSGAEFVKCDYCGATNKLPEKDKDAGTSHITINVTNGAKEESESARQILEYNMLEAYERLKNCNFFEAEEYFNAILASYPMEYRAYLGRLMAQLSVSEEKDIPTCNVDFSNNENYIRLLKYAPPELRKVYEDYYSIVKEKLEKQAAERQERAHQIILDEEEKTRRLYKKARKVSIIIVAAWVVLIVLSKLGVFAEIAHLQSGDDNAYKLASDYFEKGDYLNASANYIKANGYKDSTQKLRLITSSITTIAANNNLIAVSQKDGTVNIPLNKVITDKILDQVITWKDVASIKCLLSGEYIALKKDGTLLYAGERYFNLSSAKDIVKFYCSNSRIICLNKSGEIEIFPEKSEKTDLNLDWKGLSDIIGSNEQILGLKKDGTVLYYDKISNNSWGEKDVSSWSDVKAIATGVNFNVGLKSDGTVVAAGRYEGMYGSSWKDIVELSVRDYDTLGLKNDGTLMTTSYKKAEKWNNIISAKLVKEGIFGLKSDGTILYEGININKNKEALNWKSIVYIQDQGQYVIALKADGTFLTTDPDLKYLNGQNFSKIAITIK